MKKTQGAILLFMAAFIWGMAFVAQASAANSIGAFTFNATRSLLAALFLLTVIYVRKYMRRFSAKPSEQMIPDKSKLGGLLCGVMLFLAVNLQQFGIAAYPQNVAASGRAGFLTASYVIMIAMFAWFTEKKLRPTVLLSTVGCIIGMYMLCLSGGLSNIYAGDVLILLSAVGFTGYILTIDRFSKQDGLKISCIQFFVCGVISLIAMLIFEKPNIHILFKAWLPIFYAGIFSSGVGYTLQILGQKTAEPAVASIVMSLESVFAALAGWIILNERLSNSEMFGCVLVFISVILAQTPDFHNPASKEYENTTRM